jgi:hypothetical protein
VTLPGLILSTFTTTAIPTEAIQTATPGLVSAPYTPAAIPSETIRAGAPTYPLVTASPQVTTTRVPTGSSSHWVLLAPPLLGEPWVRASFAANAPVILKWMWERPLRPGEYFQIQH